MAVCYGENGEHFLDIPSYVEPWNAILPPELS